jgi:hypothetical protein
LAPLPQTPEEGQDQAIRSEDRQLEAPQATLTEAQVIDLEDALAEAKRVRRNSTIVIQRLARIRENLGEYNPTAQGGTRNEYGNSTRDPGS